MVYENSNDGNEKKYFRHLKFVVAAVAVTIPILTAASLFWVGIHFVFVSLIFVIVIALTLYGLLSLIPLPTLGHLVTSILFVSAQVVLFPLVSRPLIQFRLKHPSPRPMFHHSFGRYEHGELTQLVWQSPNRIADRSSDFEAWADYYDNVFLLCLAQSSIEARFDTTTVMIGESVERISIARARDKLVVVPSNGEIVSIDIPPGTVAHIISDSGVNLSLRSSVDSLVEVVHNSIDELTRIKIDSLINESAKVLPIESPSKCEFD